MRTWLRRIAFHSFFGLSAVGLLGCGADEGSPWVVLRAEAPSRLLDFESWSQALGCAVRPGAEGVWLEWNLPPEAWRLEEDGSRTCLRPFAAGLSRVSGGVLEMSLAGRKLSYRPVATTAFGKTEQLDELLQGSFGLVGDRVTMRLPAGLSRPTDVTFREFVSRGERTERGLQIAHDRVSGRGLPVWPSESWRLRTRVPRDSALRFFAAARGDADSGARFRFEVALDGESLWELERKAGPDSDAWITVLLPAEGRAEADLEFTVEGPPTLTAFMDPVIGPAHPASSAAIAKRRPNIVLFLADTFRADNLEAYGGAPERAPSINAVARESVVFEQAYGTSPWTLPSQASLFTGLHPPEHGATMRERILPRNFLTVTEVLARNGYRTAAVTDGAYISRRFQMNQGFDWFLEHTGPDGWNLDVTLERAFELLSNADGRPIFLFVQTYRTHEPYRIGPDESRDEFVAYQKMLYREYKDDDDVPEDKRQEIARSYYDYYLKGVVDLDLEFGVWWEQVRHLEDWRPGYLVFTSDHGEAFYEHGKLGHGNSLWEETTRIPLFVHGAGLAPRKNPTAASLVDLARTIAGLAGVAPEASWHGVDLFTASENSPILGFWQTRLHHRMSIVEGEHKLLCDAEPEKLLKGELTSAFDLGEDPDELEDLLDESSWPAEMARAHAEFLLQLLEAAPETYPTLSDDERAQTLAELEALGYGGS